MYIRVMRARNSVRKSFTLVKYRGWTSRQNAAVIESRGSPSTRRYGPAARPPSEQREILPFPAFRLGHLVERRREGGVGARIVAELLRRIADERETPARRRADRRSGGAGDAHAVGRLRASGLDEIADLLAEDPPIAGDHGAETVEDRQEPSSRRDDLWRLFWCGGRDLLEIAVAADDGVAAAGAGQRRVRQESPPQGFEVALRPMREAQRPHGIADS